MQLHIALLMYHDHTWLNNRGCDIQCFTDIGNNNLGAEEAAQKLRLASEHVVVAQGEMESAAQTLSDVADGSAAAPDIAGARENQDAALVLLAQALELLQPPQPPGEDGARITETTLYLANNAKGSLLGGVSMVILLYTVISMTQKVEASFNFAWYVRDRKSVV